MKETAKARARQLKNANVSLVRGFYEFIHGYGILPLAIGVVVGTAVNDLVKNIVSDLVTPLLSLVLPDGKLQGFQWTIHGSVFKIGDAINSIISFLAVAFIVYIMAKLVLRNEELLKKK